MTTTIPPHITLTPPERDLLQFSLEVAQRLQAEHDDIPSCMLALHPESGETVVVSLSGMTKQAVNQLAHTASLQCPIAVIQSAWRTRLSSKPDGAIATAIRSGDPVVCPEPRLDPNREDVVIVNLKHQTRRVMAHAKVEKSDSHANRTLPKWEFMELKAGPEANFRSANFGDPSARVI